MIINMIANIAVVSPDARKVQDRPPVSLLINKIYDGICQEVPVCEHVRCSFAVDRYVAPYAINMQDFQSGISRPPTPTQNNEADPPPLGWVFCFDSRPPSNGISFRKVPIFQNLRVLFLANYFPLAGVFYSPPP